MKNKLSLAIFLATLSAFSQVQLVDVSTLHTNVTTSAADITIPSAGITNAPYTQSNSANVYIGDPLATAWGKYNSSMNYLSNAINTVAQINTNAMQALVTNSVNSALTNIVMPYVSNSIAASGTITNISGGNVNYISGRTLVLKTNYLSGSSGGVYAFSNNSAPAGIVSQGFVSNSVGTGFYISNGVSFYGTNYFTSGIAFPTNADVRSFSVWYALDAGVIGTGADNNIFQYGSPNFFGYTVNSGSLHTALYLDVNGSQVFLWTVANDTNWHNMTICVSNSFIFMYYDGSPSSYYNTLTTSPGGNLIIGDSLSYGGIFKGVIRDFKAWDRTLTGSEASANYNFGSVSPTVAWFTLSNSIQDSVSGSYLTAVNWNTYTNFATSTTLINVGTNQAASGAQLSDVAATNTATLQTTTNLLGALGTASTNLSLTIGTAGTNNANTISNSLLSALIATNTANLQQTTNLVQAMGSTLTNLSTVVSNGVMAQIPSLTGYAHLTDVAATNTTTLQTTTNLLGALGTASTNLSLTIGTAGTNNANTISNSLLSALIATNTANLQQTTNLVQAMGSTLTNLSTVVSNGVMAQIPSLTGYAHLTDVAATNTTTLQTTTNLLGALGTASTNLSLAIGTAGTNNVNTTSNLLLTALIATNTANLQQTTNLVQTLGTASTNLSAVVSNGVMAQVLALGTAGTNNVNTTSNSIMTALIATNAATTQALTNLGGVAVTNRQAGVAFSDPFTVNILTFTNSGTNTITVTDNSGKLAECGVLGYNPNFLTFYWSAADGHYTNVYVPSGWPIPDNVNSGYILLNGSVWELHTYLNPSNPNYLFYSASGAALFSSYTNGNSTGYITVSGSPVALYTPALVVSNGITSGNGAGLTNLYAGAVITNVVFGTGVTGSVANGTLYITNTSTGGGSAWGFYTNIAIPPTSTVTNIPHGLGVTPTRYVVRLVMTNGIKGVSTGYKLNQEVPDSCLNGGNFSYQYFCDATNAIISTRSSGIYLYLPAGGGAATPITNADWNIRIYASP